MDIYSILVKFGQRYKLDRLGFDERGRCALLVDADVEMYLQKIGEGDVVYMYSPVMKIPKRKEGLRGMFSTLLKANLFGQGTRGASFSINPRTREIYFQRILVMKKVDYALFLEAFQDAIDQVRYWREKIEAQLRSADPDSDDSQQYYWRQI